MATHGIHDNAAIGITVPSVEALVALRAEVSRHRPARRAQTLHIGTSLSPLRGRGMEYAESRDYVAGDDARHIDWRLTARTGRAHTKLYQAETERLTVVLVDVSPSLFFGSKKRFKSVQAARIAATAVWSAVRDGDRVGVIVPGIQSAPRRFATGLRGALPLMHVIADALRTPQPLDATAFERQLLGLRKVLRHGARLVIVADVHTVTAIASEAWAQLAGVEVHVVLITDALEQSPPAKTLPAQLENTRAVLALDQKPAADRWQAHFSTPLAAFQDIARRTHLRVHVVQGDEAATAWLHTFHAAQAQVA
jgi:uncharacterized protein (DUF58 family)